MSSDQAPETPTKLNDSFEFSTPPTSHKGDKSDNASIAKLAFKITKTPEAVSKPKSSMKTDIIDVGVEQEDASGSTSSNLYTGSDGNDNEWSMNWTVEGYLYYYNKATGESQWAELDDPNYLHQQQPHYAATSSSGSELRKGQLVNGEEEEKEEEDEEDDSEDDSEYETDSDEDDSDDYDTDDDDSEYDSDDTDDSELDADNDGDYDSEDDPELGTAGQRGAKAAFLEQRGAKGGVVMDGEMEKNFREYMESDLGKQAMQEEQRKIERRLEKRFKAQQRKRDRRNKKSYKGKKGGSGRGAAGAGAEGSIVTPAPGSGGGGPLEAIGGALGSLFSGVATISGNVTAKASVVVDNYWKGKYHASWGKDGDDDKGGDGSKKKRRKAVATELESTAVGMEHEGARARKTAAAAAAARGENNIIDSGDLLESAMGDGETGEEGTDYESSVESVSSNDSDVKELTAPLVPQWLQADSLRRLVGSQAVDITHDLANKTLNSAEWLLEMTGYGVTVVGNIVWSKLNVVMKSIVDEHYTITPPGGGGGGGGSGSGSGSGSTANTDGLPVISAPTGATTQSYLLAAPPRAPPPGRPHMADPPHSTADSAAAVAEKKGDDEANDALEAA
jgi:hypothetical protein